MNIEHYPIRSLDLFKYSCVLSNRPLFAPGAMRESTRNRLAQYFEGTLLNDELRRRYISQFCEWAKDESNSRQLPDIWTILDCVLDENFKDLEVPIALPGTKPNLKLITAIAQQSPKLEKLKLDFISMENSEEELDKKLMKPLMLSLSELPMLTSLTLDNLPSSYKSILSLLGASCPLLSHLDVSSDNVKDIKQMLLSLLLGELADQLVPDWNQEPDWCKDQTLWRLRIPTEFLTPLCSSLRVLRLRYKNFKSRPLAHDSATVFVMRYLPILRELKVQIPMGAAVGALCDPRNKEDPDIQAAFQASLEVALHRPQSSPSTEQHLKLITSSLVFNGALLLTHISGVPINYSCFLRLIGSSCRSLKYVLFWNSLDWNGLLPFGYSEDTEEETSPEELESIFSDWPILEAVCLGQKLDWPFCKAILNSFGPKLQNLAILFCHGIVLEDLAVCRNLKTLEILQLNTLNASGNQTLLNSQTFLPNLISFTADICLGDQLRVFEEKTTLETLYLNCSHIGTTASPHLKWSGVPKLWPRMKDLSIRQASSLTMVAVDEMIPQLTNLKKLILPDHIVKDENRSFNYQVIEKLANLRPPIEISFDTPFTPCIYNMN